MAQQLQPPTQSGSGQQQQFGQQPQQGKQIGAQAGGMGQQIVGQGFVQTAPPQIQQVVNDLAQFETVAEFAHTEAMRSGTAEIAKQLNHLATIARLEKKLILGRSEFAQEYAQYTQQSLQQGIQRLQQYSQDPGVQEVVQQTQQVTGSLGQARQQLQQWSQQAQGVGTQQSGGMQSQQPGVQSTGGQFQQY